MSHTPPERQAAGERDRIDTIYRPSFNSGIHKRFFNSSGFSNFGYWLPSTRSGEEACSTLVDRLLEPIEQSRPAVLDVACGQGGTTKRLLKYFAPQDITAINISEEQLDRARANVPGCTFLPMDATRLSFEDGRFGTVMCVEAAFHFDTREAFFREAHRVLKPGGRLVLSDILLKWLPHDQEYPSANFIDEIGYKRLLTQVGFANLVVGDALRETYIPFMRAFLTTSFKETFNPRRWPGVWSDRWMFFRSLPHLLTWRRWFKSYLLVSATKPA